MSRYTTNYPAQQGAEETDYYVHDVLTSRNIPPASLIIYTSRLSTHTYLNKHTYLNTCSKFLKARLKLFFEGLTR